MKISRRFQQGATFWEMSAYTLLFLFVITAVLKLGPLYMDDMNVETGVDSVHKSMAGKDVYEVTNMDIKNRLSKEFQVSMLPGELMKQVDIERSGGQVILRLDYEERVPFVGNIDIVLRFSHERDLSAPVAE